MHQLPELVRLHRLDTGAREVARLLGVSPNTEREYRLVFTKAGLLVGAPDDLPALEVLKATLPRVKPRQQLSSLEDWIAERTSTSTSIPAFPGPSSSTSPPASSRPSTTWSCRSAPPA